MASVFLHALMSMTYVVVVVARRLRYISDYVKPMESFIGSLSPQRVGNPVFGHFNPHRWTGPDDPRVTRALVLRLGLDSLESVEDYLFPRFTNGNPTSNT